MHLFKRRFVQRRYFMETIKVKDLMVPLDQYVRVSQDATLYEAVVTLEAAQTQYMSARYPHRAVLVCDKEGKVIGKLSQLDMLKSLEPRYSELSDLKHVSGFGLSAEYMRSMMQDFDLWKSPLDDLCRKAGQVRVESLVSEPLEGEIVEDDATLNRAVHQMIMGHHQSLLVTSGDRIVGILRLTDVFKEVSDRIKACKI
jgi:predicted transcriptional regulator